MAGRATSCSIFSRTRRTWTVTVDRSPNSQRQTDRSSCSRVKTWSGCRSRKASSSYSRLDSRSGSPRCGHRPSVGVEPELAEVDGDLRGELGEAPTQDALDPQDELPGGERLGDVVVDPGLEPGDAVLGRAERGQHDDRHLGDAVQPPGDLEAVDPRQQPVEDDEVGCGRLHHPEGQQAVAGLVHAEPGRAEVGRDHLADGRVVLHHEDAPVRQVRVGRSRSRARPGHGLSVGPAAGGRPGPRADVRDP